MNRRVHSMIMVGLLLITLMITLCYHHINQIKMNDANDTTSSNDIIDDDIPDGGTSFASENGTYELKYYDKTAKTRDYYMITPKKLSSKGKLPLVVFLHGQGQSNNFAGAIPGMSLIKTIQSGKAYKSGEFIFIVPHMYWDYEGMSSIKPFIDEMKETYKDNIDPQKIILIGVSTGGDYERGFIKTYGTSKYLYKAVIIAAYTQISDSDLGNFTRTPMWFIGGTGRGNDELYRTASMLDAAPRINKKGGDVRVTVLNDTEHGNTMDFFGKKESEYAINGKKYFNEKVAQNIDKVGKSLGDYGKNLFDWMLDNSSDTDINIDFSELSVDKNKKIIKKITVGEKYSGIISKISTKSTIEIISNDESILGKNDTAKTGDKLIFTLGNKSVTYTISVLGDINGDGEIKINDVSKLYRYLKEKDKFNAAEFAAGDVVSDNEIKINDVSKIYGYLKGKTTSLK